jgi:hypothetical protein
MINHVTTRQFAKVFSCSDDFELVTDGFNVHFHTLPDEIIAHGTFISTGTSHSNILNEGLGFDWLRMKDSANCHLFQLSPVKTKRKISSSTTSAT